MCGPCSQLNANHNLAYQGPGTPCRWAGMLGCVGPDLAWVLELWCDAVTDPGVSKWYLQVFSTFTGNCVTFSRLNTNNTPKGVYSYDFGSGCPTGNVVVV